MFCCQELNKDDIIKHAIKKEVGGGGGGGNLGARFLSNINNRWFKMVTIALTNHVQKQNNDTKNLIQFFVRKIFMKKKEEKKKKKKGKEQLSIIIVDMIMSLLCTSTLACPTSQPKYSYATEERNEQQNKNFKNAPQQHDR